MDRIAVIGMGALGILYGSMLTKAYGNEKVGFIMDGARWARYEAEPVTANGCPCGFGRARADRKADMVLFAVKATGLERAMEDAAPFIGADTVLLSVLNGITSEKLLEERFGARNVVYCVAQGMDAVKSGSKLTYTKRGQLVIGIPKDAPEKQPALEKARAVLDGAQVPYTVDDDIRHRLWSKFMLNVGVNQVVMAEEGTYGTIQRPGAARDRMCAAMREVIAVADAEGIGVTEADLKFYVDLVDTLSPDGMPSMRQDGLAKRPSEVELFSGTVLAYGRKHGIDTPVNRALYEQVKKMEAAY